MSEPQLPVGTPVRYGTSEVPGTIGTPPAGFPTPSPEHVWVQYAKPFTGTVYWYEHDDNGKARAVPREHTAYGAFFKASELKVGKS